MRGLILYCPDNRPGKHDGDEFRREAEAYGLWCGAREFETYKLALTGSKAHRKQQYLETVTELVYQDLDFVAYFGHGTKASLVKFVGPKDLDWFANGLAVMCCRNPVEIYGQPVKRIILYACSAGKQFAHSLWTELYNNQNLNTIIYAHTTSGHTTCNPSVVSIANTSGGYLIAPRSELWKPWVKALRPSQSEIGEMRFRYPFMSRQEIIDELANG